VADNRRERVEHLLRAELATLLLREAKDPRLATVTISAVRLTADLRQARVFFRILGDASEVPTVERALERATPFLRTAAGRALGLRVTPALRFEYDTTPDTARRVDELLRGTREDGEDGEDGEDEGGDT
jgi:ribosome-binding factor A